MTPIKFKEVNRTLLKPISMTDEECYSLPVFTDGSSCVSRWKLSWKERLSILLFGKIWLVVISGKTQPPVYLDCSRTVFEEVSSDDAT